MIYFCQNNIAAYMKKLILFNLLFTAFLYAQFGSQDSGGELMKEQACYDVKHYNIKLKIDPSEKSLSGFVIMTADAVSDFKEIVIDLDDAFIVSSITLLGKDETKLEFRYEGRKITVAFLHEIKKGESFSIKTNYRGKPRIAKNPPWDDGFVWSTSKGDIPWVTVTCQGGGADIWWPCKDHPSDEPDSVSLHFTVPENLKCISNGKLIDVKNNDDGTDTWNWFVSSPINNYNISFYLGNYEKIEYEYTSITGDKFPFIVWALEENFEKAKSHSSQYLDHMRVMEDLIGPYPFRADKYSVVEAPHLGMEHQTAIAYGYGWKNHKDFPFDWLHHHEFSHEWWGNLVTCKDWSDFWIHEGLGTYMQPIYLERMFGKKMYFDYMKSINRFSNRVPVAPRKVLTAGGSYNLDVYYKGAWIIHTLRYYLGDEIFFKVLRKWAYPSPELEFEKNGKQCRFATTEEMEEIAEEVSGQKLSWFFENYFRYAELPELIVRTKEDEMKFEWNTKSSIKFELPVDLEVNGKHVLVEMNNGKGMLKKNLNDEIKIDPDNWLLMKINYVN